MTNLHNCPDCECGPPGEAFAPRPATSRTWARQQALTAAEDAVKSAKEARTTKPTEETR